MRAGGLAIVHRRTQARGSHHIHQYAEDARASILRKLGAYPRQKQLAAALREVGRLDRTLFPLDYLRTRRRFRSFVGLCQDASARFNHGFGMNSDERRRLS